MVLKWGKTLKHSFTLPICKIVENKGEHGIPRMHLRSLINQVYGRLGREIYRSKFWTSMLSQQERQHAYKDPLKVKIGCESCKGWGKNVEAFLYAFLDVQHKWTSVQMHLMLCKTSISTLCTWQFRVYFRLKFTKEGW